MSDKPSPSLLTTFVIRYIVQLDVFDCVGMFPYARLSSRIDNSKQLSPTGVLQVHVHYTYNIYILYYMYNCTYTHTINTWSTYANVLLVDAVNLARFHDKDNTGFRPLLLGYNSSVFVSVYICVL